MFGSDRHRNNYDSYNSGYSGWGSNARNSYGYGYSNIQQRSGLFSSFRSNRSYGGYGGYGTRRGILSRAAGGVGMGICAIGSLISHANEIKEQRKEKAMFEGRRAYDNAELSLFWHPDSGKQRLIKIPVSLDLFYLDEGSDDSGFTSRFVAKVKPAGVVQLREKETLIELANEIEDFMACGVNFTIEEKGNGFLTRVIRDGCDSTDEWIKLQAICDSIASYLDALTEWFDREGIRHEPLEYARLASMMLAAVAEQVGFLSAITVDCKQELDDEVYSWVVTDVALRYPSGELVTVRVDLLHYVFEDAESEDSISSEAGVAYFYAIDGVDLFDGRNKVEGSGIFTGWDGALEHIEECTKGMLPVAQSVSIAGGRLLKLPVISTVLTKYRNKRRIFTRRKRQLGAAAEEANTDVIFRNLLWYDTSSSAGKLVLHIVPFCILPTFPEKDGVTDKEGLPLSVGYNFFPVEKEYICGEDDLALYADEITEGVSYPINFNIVEKNGRNILRSKAVNKIDDGWERIQILAEYALEVSDSITNTLSVWLEVLHPAIYSKFKSAVLAAILGLAGYHYARPVSVKDDWSVVDVSLTRPQSKRHVIPVNFKYAPSQSKQRVETFGEFPSSVTKTWAQACSDFVIVRVDLSGGLISYSYAEDSTLAVDGSVTVSDTREGFGPFTGWQDDTVYKKNRILSSNKAKARKRKDVALAMNRGAELVYKGVSVAKGGAVEATSYKQSIHEVASKAPTDTASVSVEKGTSTSASTMSLDE